MRHTLLFFFMFLTAALSANAQATRMSLGYVNGQMKTSGTDGFSTNTKDTWVSGAIYIPADQVRLYASNHSDKTSYSNVSNCKYLTVSFVGISAYSLKFSAINSSVNISNLVFKIDLSYFVSDHFGEFTPLLYVK